MPTNLMTIITISFFKKIYLLDRDIKHVHKVEGRGRGRRRERLSSRFCAEPDAGLELMTLSS